MVNDKNIKPLKKFGQNFLRDQRFAEQIVSALNCNPKDTILEIGAGKGVLTELLINQKCKNVIAVEVDPRLVKLLENKFSGGITLIKENILNLSFKDLAGTESLKVVGNIPYNITSDILFKILDNHQYIKSAVLMVQKEVANRLVAPVKTKDYGVLTIFAGLYSSVEKLFDVNREHFYPVPNIDSSIVRFSFNIHPDKDLDYRLLKKIVRKGFNMRRKMLRNSLKKLIDLATIETISTVPLDRRPEELTIEDFKILTKELASKME